MLDGLFGSAKKKKRKRKIKYLVKRKVRGSRPIVISKHYTKKGADSACKSAIGNCYVVKIATRGSYSRKRRSYGRRKW